MSGPARRPRAAIVTLDPYNQGGVRALHTAAYRLFEAWGYDPELVCTLTDPPLPGIRSLMGWRGRHAERLGLRAFAMPSFPLPLWAWMLLPVVFGWRELDACDVVFCTSGSSHLGLLPALKGRPYALWLATVYEDELRAKIAAGDGWAGRVFHSPAWPFLRWQEKLALRRATRILATSAYTAERITALVPEAAARMSVVPLPIDTGHFRPDPQARRDSPYGDYLLLSGRINDPRKQAPMLLRAFARVRQAHPDLKLVLAGEEPNRTLIGQVNELGLNDAVIFPGLVDDDALLRLYQGAALFVLSSSQEGLGIVVLEALACGTPVVSTRCGGPDQIVTGEVGRLVPVGDEIALAGAILDLLADPARLAAMREACARYAHENFSRPLIETRIKAAVEAVLAAEKAAKEDQTPVSHRRWALAAGWAIFILAAYLIRQIPPRWPAIQSQIVEPLLRSLR